MTWDRWMAPALGCALVLLTLALCPVAWAKRDGPYTPVPQEKPCQVYWDSAKAHRFVKADPNVVAYLASRHEVIAKFTDGSGIMVTHSPKGCLEVFRLSRSQVRDFLHWLSKGHDA